MGARGKGAEEGGYCPLPNGAMGISVGNVLPYSQALETTQQKYNNGIVLMK